MKARLIASSLHSSDLVTGQAIPAIQTSNPLRERDIPPEALKQITAGLSNASRHANEAPRDRLPIDAQRMRTWALGQVKHYAAAFNPFEDEELAGLRLIMGSWITRSETFPSSSSRAASRTRRGPMPPHSKRSTGRRTPRWPRCPAAGSLSLLSTVDTTFSSTRLNSW